MTKQPTPKYKLSPRLHDFHILLYTYRFLTRLQLQQLFRHKDKKQINLWIKRLANEKYIDRDYTNKFGENTKPAVCYLSINGIKYLRSLGTIDTDHLKRYNREKKKSLSFRNQCISIADLALQFLSEERSNPEKSYVIQTRALYQQNALLTHLSPDLFITYSKEKKLVKQYALYLFNSQLPRFAIRGSIRQILTCFEQNDWLLSTFPIFPTLLIVCPDTNLVEYLSRFIPKTIEEEAIAHDPTHPLTFQLTTMQDMKKKGIFTNVWKTLRF